ncbi:VTT domain-containing protein [Roseomonas sp. NAR14]|uniref:Phospholipase D n=1 Tax=Roseomonas acroporae TaxID=2937791 RepID=A0A9X1Y4A7_9PROT|nr:VTT domain-containing protein [Roseomonas acroporae]MCK8782785.1 VTT domain-containing protein [Roseomonas acroporae]
MTETLGRDGTDAAPTAGAPAGATVLREGRNVWRVARAGRATVLSNGDAYFDALRRTLLNARSTIHVVGWDIDSRTRLVGPDAEATDGLPETLGEFLAALVARRPGLSVKLLLWDYAMLYALERELLPVLKLRWRTPPQVELCLDNVLPFAAAQHQKIVVVDDAVAFSGGLDLTIRRWDRAAHEPRDPDRVDPGGRPYPPFHDVQMMVDGEAAAALGELVRERWRRAACESLARPAPPGSDPLPDPWPRAVAPDLRDVAVGIARTWPACGGEPEIREVEALYADMIASAERTIVIENQFLTSAAVARDLIGRLRGRPGLEVLIVAPRTHHTWLEHRTMLAGRIRFMCAIREAGFGKQVRLVYPKVGLGRHGSAVMVHAKVMVVDDRLLRVGSANLANRSMGTDSECDLVVEAAPGPAGRETRIGIARVRDRLLGEHLGQPPERVAAEIGRAGSLFAALDRLARVRRGLRRIEDGTLEDCPTVPGIEAAADPNRPIDPGEFLADFSEDPPRRRMPWLLIGLLGLLPVLLLVLAWRYTPVPGLLRPGAVRSALEAGGHWGPLVALGLFLLLGFVAFPVNLLIIGTAAAFGTWPGLAYAAGGALLSAAATYALGRWLGPNLLRRVAGPRINRVTRQIGRNGIMAVTAIRLIPVAPFTLVNLVAGAIRIRFPDYMAGTALGLLPGVALMTALGDRLTRMILHPSLRGVLELSAILLAWIGLTWVLQKAVRRARHED